LAAVSPEMPDFSLSTREKNELAFDVLSDRGNRVAEQFGLVLELPEILRPVYEKMGIDIPEHNGDDLFQIPIPATYIISSEGRIVYHFVDIDHTQRAEPADIIAILKKL
jgi:peroxiredoxin